MTSLHGVRVASGSGRPGGRPAQAAGEAAQDVIELQHRPRGRAPRPPPRAAASIPFRSPAAAGVAQAESPRLPVPLLRMENHLPWRRRRRATSAADWASRACRRPRRVDAGSSRSQSLRQKTPATICTVSSAPIPLPSPISPPPFEKSPAASVRILHARANSLLLLAAT